MNASPVADMVGSEQARDGRLVMNPDLSVPEYPSVYAVGDMAASEGKDGYEPQLAQVAIQSGRHAATQVRRRLRNGTTETFEYWELGQMATIGRTAAGAEFAGGVAFKGFFAWFLWVVIHIAKLVGFRNRLSALVNWAYNYFTYSRSACLILDLAPVAEDEPTDPDAVDREERESAPAVPQPQ